LRNLAKTTYSGQVHSPFSGFPSDGDDGPNQDDGTLLFVYYGDADLFAYISDRLGGATVDDASLDDVLGAELPAGCIVLEVDTEWNGVNFYGFAPDPS
jgi:hypothetical protein